MARDRRNDDEDDDRPRRARRPRDNDDDDDRPRSARRKPKADNTVKVLLIVGGVLVVVVLICAGVALTIYSSIARGVGNAQQKQQQDFTKMAEQQQKEMNKAMNKSVDQMGEDMRKRQADAANSDKAKATEAVAAFLQEVKGGRAAAAYRQMSAEFREKTTEAAFAEFLRANATDISRTFPPHADIFAPDTGTTYAFDISTGFKKTKVTAIKQDGKWVIDVFTVTAR